MRPMVDFPYARRVFSALFYVFIIAALAFGMDESKMRTITCAIAALVVLVLRFLSPDDA